MKEQILELRAQNKTYNEIKDILKCSKGTIAYYCGEGQKAKNNERNIKRKRKNKYWIENIKSNLKCSSCNESRWWVLDFHHNNPQEKDANISFLIKTTSRKRVEEEIEKCIILCSNCHRDLHYKERINKCLHGEIGETRQT